MYGTQMKDKRNVIDLLDAEEIQENLEDLIAFLRAETLASGQGLPHAQPKDEKEREHSERILRLIKELDSLNPTSVPAQPQPYPIPRDSLDHSEIDSFIAEFKKR